MPKRPEKQAEKLYGFMLAAMYAGLLAGTLVLASMISDLWPSPEGGPRAFAAAGSYYRMGAFLGGVFFIGAIWHWRRAVPDRFGTRRLLGWCAVAGLVCAAMPTAALLALPATG